MVINYKKEIVKPDGRKLVSGGPRDQQRRLKEVQDQQSLIEALKEEIKGLKTEPVPAPEPQVKTIDKNLFTGEQVDEAVRKAVLEAISLKKKAFDKELTKINKDLEESKMVIIKLTSEVENLNKMIEDKNESLKLERDRNTQLMNQLSAKEEVYYEDPDRPKMETSFIDPLERDAGDGLTAHIDSKEVKVEERDKVYSNVEKLKGLMGKLPNK